MHVWTLSQKSTTPVALPAVSPAGLNIAQTQLSPTITLCLCEWSRRAKAESASSEVQPHPILGRSAALPSWLALNTGSSATATDLRNHTRLTAKRRPPPTYPDMDYQGKVFLKPGRRRRTEYKWNRSMVLALTCSKLSL